MNLKKHFGVKLIMLVVLCFSAIQLSAQLAPNLIYPLANDSCIEVGDPVMFTWDSVGGAFGYQLQISTSATWTQPDLVDTYISHPTSTFSTTFGGFNTNYYWRVYSVFHDTSFHSVTRRFTTNGNSPALIEPTNQESCIALNPVFEWAKMNGASGYRLQVAYTNTFQATDLVYENTSISSTTMSSVTFTTNLPHNYRNYYWRVAANYGRCVSNWSNPLVFSTIQAVPAIIYPADNSVGVATNSSLSWTGTGPQSVYDVQLATDPNFQNIIHNFVGLTSTSTTISPLTTNTDYFWKIRSRVLNCVSSWSSTKKFKTHFTSPNLDTPYEGRICLDLSYQFKWLQVTGAQSYELQIAYDSMFTNIAYEEENIFDLFHLAELTKGLTTHFWRVRAKDQNNVGAWSIFRRFKTSLNFVEPIEPPANKGGVSKSVVLKWTDVANGTGIYHLQVSSKANFSDTIVNNASLTTTTYSIILPNYNKDYYWRVSAQGQQCDVGFANPWRFKTVINKPNLTSPADLADNQPFSMFFQWTLVDSATHYEFYLSKNSNFIPVVYGTDLCPNNHIYVPAELDPDTKYYWKVRAVNQSGKSDYSSIFSFTTITRGPSVPEIQSPAVGAEQVALNPMLTWKSADRADRYHVQLSANANFSSPVVNIDTLTVTYFQVNGLQNDKTYYWHVSAINDSGETAWSKIGLFNTILTIPQYEPLLLSPVNDSSNLSLKLSLLWEKVDHATAYEVQVATDINFAQVEQQDTLVYATYLLVKDLDWATTYFWRARAKNLSGKGPWAEPFKFTTKTEVSVADELINKFNVKTFPNPFANESFISFNLLNRDNVLIKIYDMSGRELTTIINKTLNEGEHTFKWEPGILPNGTYFYSIQIGEMKSHIEIQLVK